MTITDLPSTSIEVGDTVRVPSSSDNNGLTAYLNDNTPASATAGGQANAATTSTPAFVLHPGIGKWELVESTKLGPVSLKSGTMETRRGTADGEYVTAVSLRMSFCCFPLPVVDSEVREQHTGDDTYTATQRSGGTAVAGKVSNGGRTFVLTTPDGTTYETEYFGSRKCVVKLRSPQGSGTLEWEKRS